MSSLMRELTAKQERFIQEYMIDLNATQAALRAGYCANSARQIGCENLTKPNIRQEIFKKQVKLAEKTGYSVAQAQVEYEEARQLALTTKQAGAASAAVTGKARLHGFDKDAGGGEKTIIIISPKVSKVIDSKEIE